jgi:CRISPR/Cas system-associated exonuclease Cas4 (RecB family)
VSDKIIRMSNSEIQTFKDCRRKWWLGYYRGLKPKNKDFTGALALGSRIHAALEDYYENGTPLLEAHAKLVSTEKEILLAELEVVSNEETITMPLYNGEVELTGKLDMRVRRKADGVRMFRDFKTVGGSLSDFANLAPMNEQILTYMLLEQSKPDEEHRSEGGIFTMLKKVKRSARAAPPFYDQIEVRHNVFTLRSFWDRIHGTIADMMRVRKALDDGESPSFHAYPRPSRDCKWKCQFFTVCTMMDDGSAAEQAISEMFVEGDPYDYYDTDKKGE